MHQKVSQLGGYRQWSKCADICSTRITARYVADCRADHAPRNAHQLSEDFTQITSAPADAQHAQMRKHVRPDIPLSENVGTFKVRKRFRQIVVCERALGALHLAVKGGS